MTDNQEIIDAVTKNMRKHIADLITPSYNIAAKTTSNLMGEIKNDIKNIHEKLDRTTDKLNQYIDEDRKWKGEFEKQSVHWNNSKDILYKFIGVVLVSVLVALIALVLK